MKVYPETTIKYVKNCIYNFLISLPKSKELENRYQPLLPIIKRKSTQQLKKIAEKTTENLLLKIKNINELGHLEDSDLLREVLMEAIPNND